jgi:succinate dehydrogenase / fumarate reductase membrane anchor subunit
MSAHPHKSNLRDPLARARGIGSARGGTGHWWALRVSSIALILLTPWLLWLVLSLMRADYAVVRETLAHPLHATPMLAFVGLLFWHLKLGLQVVIEDYVHTPWLEMTAHLTNTFACTLGALASFVAIGRIAFTA